MGRHLRGGPAGKKRRRENALYNLKIERDRLKNEKAKTRKHKDSHGQTITEASLQRVGQEIFTLESRCC